MRIPVVAVLASLLAACPDKPAPAPAARKAASAAQPKSGKTPKQRVAVLRKAAAATVACPPGRTLTTESLQAQVDKGQACAMAELGSRHFEGRDAPRRMADGARLLRDALARGAAVDGWSCDAFYHGIGTEPDLPLAFRCYLRAKDHDRAALMLVNGQGIARDVEAAAALLPDPDPGSTDCAADLRKLIAAERSAQRKGKPEVHRPCDVLPDSKLCGGRCARVAQSRRAWDVEQRLAKHLDRLSAEAREQVDALLRSSRELAEAEGDLIYHEYIDGSARSELSVGREALIAAHFDHDLLALFEGKLPAADAKLLALAQRGLRLADVAPRPAGRGASARKLAAKWRLVRRTWKDYVKAWERLVARVRPKARTALVQRLTLQRLYRCLWHPGTGEQAGVLDAFIDRLGRAAGSTTHETRALRAALAAEQQFEHHLDRER